MQKKALLLDPEDSLSDAVGEIYVLQSLEAIPGFLEFDSYSGDELAFLEDGERLELFVKSGREYKDLFGRVKFLEDFKYIEAMRTGDFSQLEKLKGVISRFLSRRGILTEKSFSVEFLVEILTKEIGIMK